MIHDCEEILRGITSSYLRFSRDVLNLIEFEGDYKILIM